MRGLRTPSIAALTALAAVAVPTSVGAVPGGGVPGASHRQEHAQKTLPHLEPAPAPPPVVEGPANEAAPSSSPPRAAPEPQKVKPGHAAAGEPAHGPKLPATGPARGAAHAPGQTTKEPPTAAPSATVAATQAPLPSQTVELAVPEATGAVRAPSARAGHRQRNGRHARRERRRSSRHVPAPRAKPAVAVAAARATAPPQPRLEPRPAIHKKAAAPQPQRPSGGVRLVTRSIHELVRVVPDWVKALIAALAAIALAMGAAARLVILNTRRIDDRRARLTEAVDSLEAAVLPHVPRRVGGLLTSVATCAGATPAVGGRCCDIFPLGVGRVGIVLAGVAGDGPASLGETVALRHTLRALLEAEPVPRRVLQTANRVVTDEAVLVVAVHDRRTCTLTYAAAGHSPPVLLGPPHHVPVLPAAAPIASGRRTGVRQTTVSFPAGSLACFVSDDGAEGLLSHERLTQLVAGLGPLATARGVVDLVADEPESVPADMAVCLVRPVGAKAGPSQRVEELELTPDEVDAHMAADFMRACGIGEFTLERYDLLARRTVHRYGGATGLVVRVYVGAEPPSVEILLAGREWPYAPAHASAALVG